MGMGSFESKRIHLPQFYRSQAKNLIIKLSKSLVDALQILKIFSKDIEELQITLELALQVLCLETALATVV